MTVPRPEETPKLFTVDEANQLLPQIRQVLQEIRQYHGRIQKLEVEKAVEELSWLRADGTVSPKAQAGLTELEGLQREQLQQLQRELTKLEATGVQLKDMEQGLVDFFASRGDTLIFLCWKYGEGKIRFWHDLESGFAGRRPIEEL